MGASRMTRPFYVCMTVDASEALISAMLRAAEMLGLLVSLLLEHLKVLHQQVDEIEGRSRRGIAPTNRAAA